MRRRAERVIRPTRAKTRRLRCLGGYGPFAQTNPPVQRARLCAITWTANAVGCETPRRHVVQPDAVRSRMAFSTSAWRR